MRRSIGAPIAHTQSSTQGSKCAQLSVCWPAMLAAYSQAAYKQHTSSLLAAYTNQQYGKNGERFGVLVWSTHSGVLLECLHTVESIGRLLYWSPKSSRSISEIQTVNFRERESLNQRRTLANTAASSLAYTAPWRSKRLCANGERRYSIRECVVCASISGCTIGRANCTTCCSDPSRFGWVRMALEY